MEDTEIGDDAKTAQQEEMDRKQRLQEKLVKIKEEQDKLETLKNTQLKSLLEGNEGKKTLEINKWEQWQLLLRSLI